MSINAMDGIEGVGTGTSEEHLTPLKLAEEFDSHLQRARGTTDTPDPQQYALNDTGTRIDAPQSGNSTGRVQLAFMDRCMRGSGKDIGCQLFEGGGGGGRISGGDAPRPGLMTSPFSPKPAPNPTTLPKPAPNPTTPPTTTPKPLPEAAQQVLPKPVQGLPPQQPYPLPAPGNATKPDAAPSAGQDPTVKPDALPKPPTEHEGFAFVTKTKEEADLVASLKAQGKNQHEIQTALDNLRANKGGQTSTTIADRVQSALQSSNSEKRLEGEVAQKLIDSGINVIGFNEKIGPNGSIGEIDIETDRAIIEVTVAPARKLSQIAKLSTNTDLNPHGKPVVLYAPNYGITSGKDITNSGAYLSRNFDELLPIVKKLEGK